MTKWVTENTTRDEQAAKDRLAKILENKDFQSASASYFGTALPILDAASEKNDGEAEQEAEKLRRLQIALKRADQYTRSLYPSNSLDRKTADALMDMTVILQTSSNKIQSLTRQYDARRVDISIYMDRFLALASIGKLQKCIDTIQTIQAIQRGGNFKTN